MIKNDMTILPRRRRHLILAALLAVTVSVGQAAFAKPVLNKPIYNPETKSYFELVDDLITNGTQGPGWSQARVFASKRYFKGIQGRLGIIRSAKTGMFLATHLRSQKMAWFGLYFDCEIRNLKWVTDEILPQRGYTNWNPENWNIGEGFCPTNNSIMPGVIMKGNYWALQLSGKHYNEYLVEYPTGGVEPVAQPKDDAAKAPEAEKGSQNEE